MIVHQEDPRVYEEGRKASHTCQSGRTHTFPFPDGSVRGVFPHLRHPPLLGSDYPQKQQTFRRVLIMHIP